MYTTKSKSSEMPSLQKSFWILFKSVSRTFCWMEWIHGCLRFFMEPCRCQLKTLFLRVYCNVHAILRPMFRVFLKSCIFEENDEGENVLCCAGLCLKKMVTAAWVVWIIYNTLWVTVCSIVKTHFLDLSCHQITE